MGSYFRILAAIPGFFLSSLFTMLLWGVIAPRFGIDTIGYPMAMLVTITVWLAAAPLAAMGRFRLFGFFGAAPAFFLSSLFLMLLWGVIAPQFGLATIGYPIAMLVTITLWLAVFPLAVAAHLPFGGFFGAIPGFFLSSLFLMLLWGVIAPKFNLDTVDYATAMLVTITLWLNVGSLAFAGRRQARWMTWRMNRQPPRVSE